MKPTETKHNIDYYHSRSLLWK